MKILQGGSSRLLTVVAATVSIYAFFGPVAEARHGRDDDIKLSGCLIRGEEGSGYLLANAPGDPAIFKADDHKVSPSSVGTSGGFATVFYWLYGNDDLDQHVGQRVEVEGDVQGEIHDGEIKTHRKDRWTEVEVKSSGRTMKARVPNASFALANDRAKEKGGILVRRVNVDKVKMVGARCE
jgi:hypothetical protein